MKLIFYRHLPTDNNLNGTFIGRMDLRCNAAFIKEHLTDIREKFALNSFSCIFCSPLLRARESASLYFPDETFIIDRRLIERDLGEWKNVSKKNVKSSYPQAFFSNGNLNFDFTPPGGEKFEYVLKRVASFILDVYDNYNENDVIAIVTHNGIITAVKCLINKSISTELIEFQPFLKEYTVDITTDFINQLEIEFSSF